MKKQFALLCVMVSSTIFLSPVLAEGAPGFYIGGGLGVSRLDTKERGLFDNRGWDSIQNSTSRGGLGWKISAGYNLNEYFGFELSYNAYANSKYMAVGAAHNTRLVSSRKNTMNAVAFVVKPSIPVGDTGFNVYGLGGGAQMNGRVASTVGAYSSTSEQKKFRPMYGAGLGYSFSEQLSANLELSRIQGDNKNAVMSFPNADALTLNLAYHLN